MFRSHYDEEMECLAPEAEHRLNERLFDRLIAYLFQCSPFYQQKLGEAGFKPGAIRGLQDLPRLPMTTKEELRESQKLDPPFGRHRACSPETIVRVYSTSGTTGTPTYIGLTRHDLDLWIRVSTRSLWSRGVRPGDRVVSPLGAGPFVGGLANEVVDRLGACLIPLGPGHTERVVASHRALNANVLLATPSYAFHLKAHCAKIGLDPRELGIRLCLVAGEPGGGVPAIRSQIEEAFGCRVLEAMGNGDAGLSLWSECHLGNGMHFMAQGMILPELINPDTDLPVEVREGMEGELLYTTLNRECVPLLRFRTRDRVRVLGTRCECGRTGVRIRCIGRTDDMLIIRGVNVYPSAIEEIVAGMTPRTTGRMEIVLDRPGPAVDPPLKIRVEITAAATDITAVQRELEDRIRSALVVQARIEPVPAGSLKSFEYKRQLIRRA
jgi:phenylacetate-CoA ligase